VGNWNAFKSAGTLSAGNSREKNFLGSNRIKTRETNSTLSMRTPFKILARMVGAGALAFLAQAAHSQVLYQNTSANQGENFNYSGEAGNEVILAGSAASDLITGFEFQFDYAGSSASPDATADLTFYENNGGKVAGYASPGTEIWSSGAFPIGGYTAGSLADFDKADLGGGVLVPKIFTWTVTFSGLQQGESAGLAVYGAPTVGKTYGDAWLNDGWELKVANTGPALEFGAEIQGFSVPDSSSLSIAVISVLAGFAWMKRKKRRA
jgi:hypothetical protein